MNITFVTNTEGKVLEAQAILGSEFKLTHHKLDLDEIQAIDGHAVVERKAREAYSILKTPILIEDTSLYFDAWNGLPGALARWFLDAVGCEGICKMFASEQNRKAKAESLIAFFDGKEITFAEGIVRGEVPAAPRGDKGFGWDPIFMPDGSNKTFGEMEQDEKIKYSMRRVAFEELRKKL